MTRKKQKLELAFLKARNGRRNGHFLRSDYRRSGLCPFLPIYPLTPSRRHCRPPTAIDSITAPPARKKQIYLNALDLYATLHHLDFEDALAIAHVEDLHLTDINSYDRDFARVPGVTRVEP
jgi:hypothetical protein